MLNKRFIATILVALMLTGSINGVFVNTSYAQNSEAAPVQTLEEAKKIYDDAYAEWKKAEEESTAENNKVGVMHGKAFMAIKKDNPEYYAKSRLAAGLIYKRVGGSYFTNMALQCFNLVLRDDHAESYAQAQYQLADMAYVSDTLEDAIAHVENVKKEDHTESYALSKKLLGDIYKKNKDFGTAVAYYREVEESDSTHAYILAQMALADTLIIYKGKTDEESITLISASEIKEAEAIYKNILTKINKRDNFQIFQAAEKGLAKVANLYEAKGIDPTSTPTVTPVVDTPVVNTEYNQNTAAAKFKFSKGQKYKAENKLDEAIKIYEEITREESRHYYALAQINLALIFEHKENMDTAIKKYSNIQREDNPEEYARAQFNLGNYYANEEKIVEAREHYDSILPTDDAEIYNNAMFNAGTAVTELRENPVYSTPYFEKVKKEINPALYAQAQWSIGYSYQMISDAEKSIKPYKKVLKEDNPEFYSRAQYGLLITYYELDKLVSIDEAMQHGENISKEDAPEVYAMGRKVLGDFYKNRKKDLKKAKQYYKQVDKNASEFAYGIAQNNLASLLESQGNLNEAVATYNKVLKLADKEEFNGMKKTAKDAIAKIKKNPDYVPSKTINTGSSNIGISAASFVPAPINDTVNAEKETVVKTVLKQEVKDVVTGKTVEKELNYDVKGNAFALNGAVELKAVVNDKGNVELKLYDANGEEVATRGLVYVYYPMPKGIKGSFRVKVNGVYTTFEEIENTGYFRVAVEFVK